MKIVGLISGGKDSCYNMMQCVSAGHTLVALAHIKPSSGDEQDSMMYQSVGHEGVALYAEAMGLPLYTGITQGRTSQTSLTYQEEEGDEVEDLWRLLNSVKDDLCIEGVSVGAVLSDYQRIRVENVCQRLDLVSLAYLWRREQSSLLRDMILDGVCAILVKVASIGLEASHLGKNLKEMLPILEKLNGAYGVSVCGEGGEYETFTIDCPLFKKKIEIHETQIIVHSDDAFAPVAYLKLKKLQLQDKQLSKWPPLPDALSTDKVDGNSCSTTSHSYVQQAIMTGKWVWLAMDGDPTHLTVGNQCQQLLKTITEKLKRFKSDWNNVPIVYLYLRRMSDYKTVNEIYCPLIRTRPPSRVCVSTLLPEGVFVRIEVLASLVAQTTSSYMHVQSLSYWAPPNIGPYSQAYVINGVIFLAGEIGLIPHLNTMADTSSQPSLSLSHSSAILKANGSSFGHCLSGVCYCASNDAIVMAEATWRKHLVESGPAAGPGCPVAFVLIPELPRGAVVEWQFTATKAPTVVKYFAQCHIDSSSRYLVHLQAAFTAKAPHLPHWVTDREMDEVWLGEEPRDSLAQGCYMVSIVPLPSSLVIKDDNLADMVQLSLSYLSFSAPCSTSQHFHLLRMFLPQSNHQLNQTNLEGLVCDSFHSELPLSIVPLSSDHSRPIMLQFHCY